MPVPLVTFFWVRIASGYPPVSLTGFLASIARSTPSSSVQPLISEFWSIHQALVPLRRAAIDVVSGTWPKILTPEMPACDRAWASPSATLPMIAYTYLVLGEDCSFETTALGRAGVPIVLDCTTL